MRKTVTTRICENVLYLAELNGFKYTNSIEYSLGLSRGYLSRCLNNPSKRLAADELDIISRHFDVSVDKLMYHDLREEGYGQENNWDIDPDWNVNDLLEDM